MMNIQPAKLTKEVMDRLPPAASGQYIVRDTEEPGFFVVVGARTKTFTVQVDVLDALGKRATKKRAIGKWPQMGVAEARRAAREAKVALGKEGVKPAGAALTLGEGWAELRATLLRDVDAGRRSNRTVETYEYGAKLLADWADTPLSRLSDNSPEVRKRHRDLTAARGPRAAARPDVRAKINATLARPEVKARISAQRKAIAETPEGAAVLARARAVASQPEVRAKMSAVQKEVQNRPEVRAKHRAANACPEVAARRSAASKEALARPEVRALMSAVQKEAMNRPEVRAKQRAAQLEAQNRPEVKARKAAALKEAMNRPDVKAKVSAAQKEANARPEVKARRSAASKEVQKRPEVKAKQSAAMRRVHQRKRAAKALAPLTVPPVTIAPGATLWLYHPRLSLGSYGNNRRQ